MQVGFRKGRGTIDQIANIHWIIEQQENYRKASTSSSLTVLKNFWLCRSQLQENSSRDMNNRLLPQSEEVMPLQYQVMPLPASWEICMQVKKQKLKPDMEQWTGSKLRKAVYCHLAYLTYMQSASVFQGEILIPSDIQMTPPLWKKAKRN